MSQLPEAITEAERSADPRSAGGSYEPAACHVVRARSWPVWPGGSARSGGVAGVDDAEEAVRTAGALIEQLDLGRRVDIVRVRIEANGLAASAFGLPGDRPRAAGRRDPPRDALRSRVITIS